MFLQPPVISLLDSLPLDNGDVAVDGQVREALDQPAGLRPLDFQQVNLGAWTEPQHDTRIVRGKVASPADPKMGAPQVARLAG